MNTSALSFSIFLVFLLIGCDDPFAARNELVSSDRLIEKFSLSPEFEQLKAEYRGINVSTARVVEFNQNRVILLPIYSTEAMTGGSRVLRNGIIVEVSRTNSFLGSIKVKIVGSPIETNTNFSGLIEIEQLTNGQQVIAGYVNGELSTLKRLGSSSGRTSSNEVCELLECVSDRISQAGFIEQLICGFDPIQCVTVIISECLFLEDIIEVSI